MYKRGRRPIPAPDIIPTTVLQRRTWRARARTRLVGDVRSGARAHRGLAPFLRSFHYYHTRIDTLSVFLSSSTTPTVLLTRAFSLFPIRLLFLVFFLCSWEGGNCVPHDNFGWKHRRVATGSLSRIRQAAEDWPPPVTSAQTFPGWKDDSKRRLACRPVETVRGDEVCRLPPPPAPRYKPARSRRATTTVVGISRLIIYRWK